MVDPQITTPVGLAGFHGAPDATGMVEIGYRIDPVLRRRGYARRSLETLLAVAQGHPDVRTIRATISPDNKASRALIDSYGFVKTGEQWDEEDGLDVLPRDVGQPGHGRPSVAMRPVALGGQIACRDLRPVRNVDLNRCAFRVRGQDGVR